MAQGIFINVMARLEEASFAAAITRAKTVAGNAAKDIDKQWSEANAAVNKSLSNLVRAENEATSAAERRDRAESKAEQATLNRMRTAAKASDEQTAAVKAYMEAQEQAATLQQEIAEARVAQLRGEVAATDTLIAKQAELAAAQRDVKTAQEGVVAAGAVPLATKANAEADAQAALANRTNDAVEASNAAAIANQRHAQAQDQVTESTTNANRAFNIIGGSSLLLGAGFLELGKKAADFNQKIITLNTAGNELAQNNKLVADGIMHLATQTGNSANSLADAMLMVEKAGYHGQEALDVMTAATQTAKSEHADLKDVVVALTTSLRDYHVEAGRAPDVASKMVTAANLAKAPLQDLAKSYESIDPVAMTYGASQEQVLAMLAKVTQTGESPQRAAENLANMMQHIGTPTNVMRQQMGKIGLNADDFAKQMSNPNIGPIGVVQDIMSKVNAMTQDQLVNVDKLYKNPELAESMQTLQGAIKNKGGQDLIAQIQSGQLGVAGLGVNKKINEMDPSEASLLMQYVQGYRKLSGASTNIQKGETLEETRGQILKEITGTQETMKMMSILGGTPEDMQATQDMLHKISDTLRESDGSVKGFNQQMQGTASQLQQAKANIGNAVITLGNDFAPALKAAAAVVSTFADILKNHKGLADLVGYGAIAFGALFALTKVVGALSMTMDTTKGWISNAAGSFRNDVTASGAALKTSSETAGTELKTGGRTFQTASETAGAELKTSAGIFGGKLRGLGSVLGMIGAGLLPNGDGSLPGQSGINNAAMMSWLAGPEVGIPATLGALAYDSAPAFTRWTNNLSGATADAQATDQIQRQNQLGPYSPQIPLDTNKLNNLLTPGMAGGGVLPGYSPGKDNLLGMVNGRPIGLSGGEGILVPEAVQALGPHNVMALNSFYSHGRKPGGGGYASGGLLPSIAQGMTNILLGQWGLPAGSDPWAQAAMMSGGMGYGMGMPMMSMAAGMPASQGGLKGMAQQLFSRFGWGASEWGAFDKLITKESAWNPTAKNPSSTAYGLGQFLNTTGAQYPGSRSNNPAAQLMATMQYVKDRYGTPSNAWAFHLAHNWYSGGGILGYDGGTSNVGVPDPSTGPDLGGGFPALFPLSGAQSRNVGKTGNPVIDALIRPSQIKPFLDYIGQAPAAPPDDDPSYHNSFYKQWYGGDSSASPSTSPSAGSPDTGDSTDSSGDIPGDYSGGDYSSMMSSSANPMFSSMSGSMPMMMGGQAGNVMQFAQFANRIPYKWGGFGVNGVDCSGLALAFANVATGKDPFSGGGHPMSTANEGDYLTKMGFQPGPGGPGSLTIGWSDSHTGITLPDGTNIEAMDSRDGVVMGQGSKGAHGFPNVMHLALPGGGMPSMMGGSMPGMGGMNGMSSLGGFGGSDSPGMYNPLESAGQGGFTIPNIARLMTTFLAELALGNPLGRLMAGQYGGAGTGAQNGMMSNGMVSPLSPQFANVMNTNTDALQNFNGMSAQQIENQAKLNNALLSVQTAKTPAARERAMNNLAGLQARQSAEAQKNGLTLGNDETRLGELLNTRQAQKDRVDELSANAGTKPSTLEAAKNALGKTNDAIGKMQLQTIPQAQSRTIGGPEGLNQSGIGPNYGPGMQPGGGPSLPALMPSAGQGMPMSRGMLSPASFGGFSPAQPAQPSSMGPGMGAQQYGTDNKSPGFGTQLASSIMSAIPGANAMPGSAQIGQLLNRTAGYLGQLGGIAAEGLMETFTLNDSSLADPSKSLPGKIIFGIAGAHPSGPNTAGQTQPPLKPKDDKGKSGEKSDLNKKPGLQITNNFHGTNDNAQKVNREQNYGMMMNGGGPAIQ